jgi:hypothetical protein
VNEGYGALCMRFLVRNPADISCACTSSDWKNKGIMGLTVHQFPTGYASGNSSAPEFLNMLALILSETSAAELDHLTAAGPSAEELHTPTKQGSRNSRSGLNAMRKIAIGHRAKESLPLDDQNATGRTTASRRRSQNFSYISWSRT